MEFQGRLGAVRSGKTFQDVEHLIPKRIRERADKSGLVVLIGVTEATVERNLLRPMRDKFGHQLVSRISQNKVWLFGEECYALGAEKVNQVSKIQGASFKYVYGDEVAKWHKDVFDMIKSRLDQDYSQFDGTCNPESASHWLKEFLDSNADIYCQHYILDDNTFISQSFKDNLKKEYAGTVLYERYILGRWVNAEGVIYRKFADDPNKFVFNYESKYINDNLNDNLPLGETVIGVDYGGTKSGQAYVCLRISSDYRKVIALASRKITKELDDRGLLEEQLEFIDYCMKKYQTRVDYIYPDNANPTHIRSLENAVMQRGWSSVVRACWKLPIKERIEGMNKMLAFGVFKYIKEECSTLEQALNEALWDSKVKNSENQDIRLDDFTSDIDTLDALEYAFERDIRNIIDKIDMEISYD